MSYKYISLPMTSEKRSEFFDDTFVVDTNGLEQKKLDQIKRIRQMVEDTLAYSQFYYTKAGMWKKIYWITSVSHILLMASNSVINTIFDPCVNEETMKKYNMIFSFSITIALGIITLLNATERNKDFEIGGDKYNQVSEEIFRNVFYNNQSLKDLDLQHMIELFNMKIDNNRELFPEPSILKLENIKLTENYKKRDYFRKVIIQ